MILLLPLCNNVLNILTFRDVFLNSTLVKMNESQSQPRIGRGRAFLSSFQAQDTQQPGAETPAPAKGRGLRLLQALEKAKAQKPGDAASQEGPVRPRGRAALLQKMYEMDLGKTVEEKVQNISDDTISDELGPCKYEGKFLKYLLCIY